MCFLKNGCKQDRGLFADDALIKALSDIVFKYKFKNGAFLTRLKKIC